MNAQLSVMNRKSHTVILKRNGTNMDLVYSNSYDPFFFIVFVVFTFFCLSLSPSLFLLGTVNSLPIRNEKKKRQWQDVRFLNTNQLSTRTHWSFLMIPECSNTALQLSLLPQISIIAKAESMKLYFQSPSFFDGISAFNALFDIICSFFWWKYRHYNHGKGYFLKNRLDY